MKVSFQDELPYPFGVDNADAGEGDIVMDGGGDFTQQPTNCCA